MADHDDAMELDAIEIDPATLQPVEDGEELQDLGDNLELADGEDQNPAELLSVEPQIIMDDTEYDDNDDIAADESEQHQGEAEGVAVGHMEHFLEASSSSMHENSNSEDGMDMNSRRSGASSSKTPLGSMCPICDHPLHKQHSRDHVAWHFMEELKAYIIDPSKCPECSYMGDKLESVARHLALYHQKLDQFLSDTDLVAEKRAKAMAKPKKVSVGSQCIICGLKDPSREHVSRHFMKELMEIVEQLPDQQACPECRFRGEKPQNVARHIALVHSKLDEFLCDEALVEERRREQLAKPNKVNIGNECPVCDQAISKQHSRVHVIWHFMEELRGIVQSFNNPTVCDLCNYTNQNVDKVAKHIALGHSKLDELLLDEELMEKKRAIASTKPKKTSIGPSCPICDVRDPAREHVARHFGDELNEVVNALENKQQCPHCNYSSDKVKNLGIHIALVHGQLDEYLANNMLIQMKRNKIQATPKKMQIGPQCPICEMRFTKGQNRDHVSWHFMDELREFVQTFPNPNMCAFCNYVTEKQDNLVKHVALGHSKLDEYLLDEALVAAKRAKAMSKPKKISLGPCCPVCDVKDPAREHVARHFGEELLAYIQDFGGENPTACNECEYKGDKPKTLGIHVALVHGKLDILLADQELVQIKRHNFFSKPKKLSIGPKCPICEMQFTKSQNRDHVSYHFAEELKAIVNEFPDPKQCTQCSYVGDSLEKMIKHVALGHSMLDGFLQDEELVEEKRLKALTKPPKVELGKLCPVCDNKDPTREHVARHFGDELMDVVLSFPDQTQCSECSYVNEKAKNVAIHIALVHNLLDQCLANEELVAEKRAKHFNKLPKTQLGLTCIICDTQFTKSGQNRDHVCWHFMDELRDIVMTFEDKEQCPECPYTSDKMDNMVKHIALGHSKIDELLLNTELIESKRAIAMSKVKKISIGPECPICGIKFTKANNRDHVAWHFMEELRDYARSTGTEKACSICWYTTDKLDNLVKHYALGHSKLDELLQDEELVEYKRAKEAKKPKRMSFGNSCPICGVATKERDHVARHFMAELMEMVNELPKKSKCNQCDYSNSRNDYMAKHLGLYHCKLDELMRDEELVNEKKRKASNAPKKIPMGEKCVICNITVPSREHVARHFLPELLEMIKQNSKSMQSCYECHFTAEKPEYVARHIGLVHCKLDEILSDPEKVAKKVAEFGGTGVGSAGLNLNSLSPNNLPSKVLPVREAVRKSQRQREAEEKQQREMETSRRRDESKRKSETTVIIASAKKPKVEMMSTFGAAAGGGGASAAGMSLLEGHLMRAKLKSAPTTSPAAAASRAMQLMMKKQSPPPPAAQAQAATASPAIPLPSTSAASSDSLLMQGLLKGGNISITKANKSAAPSPWSKNMKVSAGEDDSIDMDQSGEVDPAPEHTLMSAVHSGKVTIKRATKAKWQIKPQEQEQEQVKHQQEYDEDEDFAQMIVPEVSHSLGEDGEDIQEDIQDDIQDSSTDDAVGGGEDAEDMYLEPQIILDTSAIHEEPHEFCDVCGLENDGAPCCNADEAMTFDACPVCDVQAPSREHVSRHFVNELVEVVQVFPDEKKCPQCPYGTPDNAKMAVHIALAHAQLEIYLEDASLVSTKREAIAAQKKQQQQQQQASGSGLSMSAGKSGKFQGTSCPICEQMLNKAHSRDHIVWHFMEQLRSFIIEDTKCPECNYTGEKSENVARHLALFHGKLDQFLADKDLVLSLRAKVLSKPKKVAIGSLCPVCDFKDPPREHVARHFMDELLEHVQTLPDPLHCHECNYKGDRPQNLAKHIALVHSMLDVLLNESELVASKRHQIMSKPKKVFIGDTCPVCDAVIGKRDSRVHVIWHFMDELKDIVLGWADPHTCEMCGYTNQRVDKMAKHMALGHSKLDEFLQNSELVAAKRGVAKSKPKKLTLGPQCPICDMQFTKSQNRDHVSWHFMDELREYVQTFPDPTTCPEEDCIYSTDKLDNLVKHMALGHSKLDELLLNEELVAVKRQIALSKPKKVNVGHQCPICEMPFPKGQNRDHVVSHFTDEIKELIMTFPDQRACLFCDYTCERTENLIKHLGLGHSKLDEFLLDEELVAYKRERAMRKQKRFPLGETCPICDMSNPPRDHVARHFMEELTEYCDRAMPGSLSCNECDYQGPQRENLAKHVALFHCKLDEYLFDTELVQAKRNNYNAKQLAVDAEVQCPVCDKLMPKPRLREHCTRHFAEEITAIVHSFNKQEVCGLCDTKPRYKNSGRGNMYRHVALTHGKLEEFLGDEELMKRKRASAEAEAELAIKEESEDGHGGAATNVAGASSEPSSAASPQKMTRRSAAALAQQQGDPQETGHSGEESIDIKEEVIM